MRSPKEPLWSRRFALACVIAFLVGLVFVSLTTTIALYAINRFRASEGTAGFVAGCFVLGAMVSRVLFARFIDRFGRRRSLLIALALFTVAAASYLAVGDLTTLILVRFVHGAAFGVAHNALTTAAMSLVPDSRRAEGTGYYGMAAALTTGLGPFIAVLLQSRFTPEAVFVFTSVCSAAALIVACFLRPSESEVYGQRLTWRFRGSDLIEPTAVAMASVVLVCAGAYSGVMAFLAAHAGELGVPEYAATFFLVFAAVVFLSRFFLGRIQDRFGDNVVMYPIFVGLASGLLVLGLGGGSGILVAAVLLGIEFGGLSTSAQAIVVARAPRGRMAIAIATYYTFLDTAIGFGPMLLGVLAASVGYAGMYQIGAGVVVLGAILYTLVHGRGSGRRGRQRQRLVTRSRRTS